MFHTPAHRSGTAAQIAIPEAHAARPNAVLHVPAHKQRSPLARPSQLVDGRPLSHLTDWHLLVFGMYAGSRTERFAALQERQYRGI